MAASSAVENQQRVNTLTRAITQCSTVTMRLLPIRSAPMALCAFLHLHLPRSALPLSSNTRRASSYPRQRSFLTTSLRSSHQSALQRDGTTTKQCFRLRSQRQTSGGESSINHDVGADVQDDVTDPISSIEQQFSRIAKKQRTWKRLGHLVDLAVDAAAMPKQPQKTTTDVTSPAPPNDTISIADVGTDHGLLAVGVALSLRFHQVTGVDVSKEALNNGAISLLNQIRACADGGRPSGCLDTIDFRHGDGLNVLQPGEGDAVVIAGMGVNTMLQILQLDATQRRQQQSTQTNLGRIGTRHLLLQPTNSKPKNLCLLYDALQRDGWKLEDERIESLSSRWYLSSRFSKLHEDASASSSQMQVAEDIETLALPGERLLPDPQGPVDDAMRTCFSQYVEHHVAWIQKDAKIGARQSESEAKWLERFQSAQESS